MTNQFGLTRIGQISIAVHDLERAIGFYRETLGMRFLFQAPPGLAFFECGGIRLMLTLPEGGSDHHTSVIYYDVADIHAAADALKSRGVVFESEPHFVAQLGESELWMGFLRDPDGNLLAVMSEVAA